MHWAYRVRDRFPDGQLYVNLRGFDPTGQVVAPEQAIRGFLDALGVPPDRVPSTVDAQAGLYRSLLAGRRVLVLLDNARDADQVRPLLPGTATALVLATSRDQLTALVAADGAWPLTVDLLTEPEARDLLIRRVGADRIAAEPRAVEEIIRRCARLPLALAIVAARAAVHRGFTLTALAADLTGTGQPLDSLTAGSPGTDLRAVFSWSYAALPAPAGRLFRLLGLHPGPDVSVPAAASLAALPRPEARRLLAELARANLITEHVPGRYSRHDLLAAYAADLTGSTDPAEERRAALGRLLDHYVHAGYAADRLLNPTRDPIPAPAPTAGDGESPGDEAAAVSWLTAEYPVVLASVPRAAEAGFDAHAWQLAWALDTFLDRRGHWRELADMWQTAVLATDRLGDRTARAVAHGLLGWASTRLGRHADADRYHRRSLDDRVAAGDLIGQAHTHTGLAHVSIQLGRSEQGLDHAQQAYRCYRAAGYRRGEAVALNTIGWCHAQRGAHAEALTWCERALTLLQQAGDRIGQANTWDSLGYAHRGLGQFASAADCYRQASALFRDVGDRYQEADALTNLGDSQHAAGDPAAARTGWQQALGILTDLHHADAERVRTRLQDADATAHP